MKNKFKILPLLIGLSINATAFQATPNFNQIGVETECSRNNTVKFDIYNNSSKEKTYKIRTEKYLENMVRISSQELIVDKKIIKLKPFEHKELVVHSNVPQIDVQSTYGIHLYIEGKSLNSIYKQSLVIKNGVISKEKVMNITNTKKGQIGEILESALVESHHIPIFINGKSPNIKKIEYVKIGNGRGALIYNLGSRTLFLQSDFKQGGKYKKAFYILPGSHFSTDDKILAHRFRKLNDEPQDELGCAVRSRPDIEFFDFHLRNIYSQKLSLSVKFLFDSSNFLSGNQEKENRNTKKVIVESDEIDDLN